MTSLVNIWIDQKEFFESKTVEQVLSISGDGNLRDGNKASEEFRSLLMNLPPDFISRYINDCLNHAFQQSGLVLQDLVNEIGRRLGFSIEPGYYRGGGSRIGFDGIWRAKDGHSFIIEVKTTDAYQLNLDKQAEYRQRLIEENRVKEDQSSILLVVGRKETGGLEAQTRGSRHAWDVRIIGVDALLKLMHIKINLSDATTILKIQEILKPLEYTRVDNLIDIIFKTSEDLQINDVNDEPGTTDHQYIAEAQSTPVKYHEECADRISAHLKVPLIKLGRSSYTNADQSIRVLCIVSKEYRKGGTIGYWYAFHPTQQDFLNEGDTSFVALGCGSSNDILLIPSGEFQEHLPVMSKTEKEGRFYWHVRIFKKGNRFLLNKPTSEGIEVTRYKIK